VGEKDVALEQRGQRVECPFDRAERNGDANLFDEVVLEPLKGVAQRVELDVGALRGADGRASVQI